MKRQRRGLLPSFDPPCRCAGSSFFTAERHFRQGGSASAAPARNDIQRQKAFNPAQRRGDLKEGISPSFIVSIRGVKRGKKSKSSPSCVVLFPPFSWTSKRKGIVSRALCTSKEKMDADRGRTEKYRRKNNVPSAHPRLILRPRDAIIPLHEHPL